MSRTYIYFTVVAVLIVYASILIDGIDLWMVAIPVWQYRE